MLKIIRSNVNSYELLSCKALMLCVLQNTDTDKIYLLRSTTVSPYMSRQLLNDIQAAISMSFSIHDLCDLCDCAECLSTQYEVFKEWEHVSTYNWHAWALTRTFHTRFTTLCDRGIWKG